MHLMDDKGKGKGDFAFSHLLIHVAFKAFDTDKALATDRDDVVNLVASEGSDF